jgi:glucosamine--fructose-6-phosphate aminotransferase (isomerizing)
MCGIFAIVNDKTHRAAQTTLEGLKKLEYRGYDSWGVAVVTEKGASVAIEKHVGKIGGATTGLPNGTIAIGHTRWATHGGVTDQNAHPHLDCTGRFVVIHNGIVENYQELKQNLIKKHHVFHSETDTEVIAHSIEDAVKNKPTVQAVLEVFSQLAGSNAIVVLDAKTKTIVACRNGSPLVAGIGDESFFLASDVPAFLRYTSTVHFLSDGEAVVLSNQGIKLFDIRTIKTKPMSTQTLDWKLEDAEKGGYPHFMIKEIMEQVRTVPKTAQVNNDVISAVAKQIQKGNRVVLTACGTASYCALAAKYFFADIGLEVQSYGAYEFAPFAKFSDKKTVLFAISQSGETADTLIATKKAKQNGAYIVAVVNARGSTLERLSDAVIPVGAGPEIAVVSTKAFTSQLSTLYLVSQAVTGTLPKAASEITTLGRVLETWLTDTLCEKIIKLAKDLVDHTDMYVIGKHTGYPAGLEFALKIKETSYIHAEPFAAGELKHGVITLIQKGTPCFVIATQENSKLELLSSAAELKARGGKIIGVAPFPSAEFDVHVPIPDAGPLTIIPAVIVGQLLGYYLGIGRGTDPDKPRNLAKSVTVK